MTTAEKSERYLLGNYARFPLAFTHGEGGWLVGEDGKRYLDFATGIAVSSLGHGHPAIAEALARQGKKLIHSSNLYQVREQADLAEFLVETVVQRPGKVFFCNSGAEANDTLIKLARKHAHDRLPPGEREAGVTSPGEIVTCKQSFHGRTLGGIAATGQEKVKIGFDPLLPGFLHVPFNDPDTLREAVTENTVGILLEPIQGEGGIHSATPEFLAAAAELRDRHGLLLLFDEVQCGVGRTGRWCGWRSVLDGSGVEVEPDAVSWAKGLGGGFPIGGIWAANHCAPALGPGTHGSTFGGTPLGSAVALAVLRELERSGALANVARQSARIREQFDAWKSSSQLEAVADLRGAGLLLGFVLDREKLQANDEFAASGKTPALFVVEKLMEAGMLTVPAGPGVVRWLPRLNVTDEEVGTALRIFAETVGSLC